MQLSPGFKAGVVSDLHSGIPTITGVEAIEIADRGTDCTKSRKERDYNGDSHGKGNSGSTLVWADQQLRLEVCGWDLESKPVLRFCNFPRQVFVLPGCLR